MPYTHKQWSKRIAERTDISSCVVHLTREQLVKQKKITSLEVLFKIISEKKLIGSSNNGFIIGDKRAVCFQESPLPSLAQNVYFEQKYRETNKDAKIRYKANGLAFSKPRVYRAGGRPVIYEDTAIARAFLPKEEWWRIVKLDLAKNESYVDWSHEREWRIAGDFDFELKDTTVLLSNRHQYRKFVEMCENKDRLNILRDVRGIVVLDSLLY